MNDKLKVGIITFHNSNNCGSMLETYAIQTIIEKLKYDSEIINFSSKGQIEMYKVFFSNNSLKGIIKNILILPHYKKISFNNQKYEAFKKNYFRLNKNEVCSDNKKLSDKGYDFIVAGSDQIWNITIPDYDNAYFLNWVSDDVKKIAYAPSFGAKNIIKYSNNPSKFTKYIKRFNSLSIRENNGQVWIKDLTGLNVPVVLDPTLLLVREDYEKLVAHDVHEQGDYIFFYCPSFDKEICDFVKMVASKYNLRVVVWSSKSYFVKFINRFGFKLAQYENPSSYLYYIKNAKLIFTTSFHGTVFSTIFRKNFYTIMNGGMYGDDDRVMTLVKELGIEDRLIPYNFDTKFDYMKNVDYTKYDKNLPILKKKSINYLKDSLKK